MGPLHIIALLGCAEWLLIFRTWVSLRYLLLYAGVAFLQLRYFLTLFPHWDSNYYISWALFVAIAWHIRSLWRANTAHNQQTYDTPPTGIPWLVIVTRNWTFAPALEFAIIVAFIYYMADTGTIIYRREFLTLPPSWQAWLATPPNNLIFVWGYALWTPFSYVLWYRANAAPKVREKKEPETQYKAVRPQTHSKPELQSVNDLMKGYDVDSRDF